MKSMQNVPFKLLLFCSELGIIFAVMFNKQLLVNTIYL